MDTRDLTRDLIKKYGSGNLLDVGAGYGRYKNMLEPYVAKYFSSDNFDTRADFKEDSAHLTHAENTFNTILCNQLLEHAADPEGTVREIYRVLQHGGYAIVTVPFLFPEHADPSDFRRYTRSGLKDLFSKVGFIVIECKSYGGVWSMLAEFVRMATRNPYKPKRSPPVRKIGFLHIVF